MKRLIAKPSEDQLIECLDGKLPVPYQWINWWLYQKGVDDLIKSSEDYDHPLYWPSVRNKERIMCEIAEMMQISHRRLDVMKADDELLGHLFNRKP